MAPPKKQISSLPSSTQKTKPKSERIIPFIKGKLASALITSQATKEQRRGPVSALPLTKEDGAKKKDKLSEKKRVSKTRKKQSNDGLSTDVNASSPHNIDYKAVKKKLFKKAPTKTAKVVPLVKQTSPLKVVPLVKQTSPLKVVPLVKQTSPLKVVPLVKQASPVKVGQAKTTAVSNVRKTEVKTEKTKRETVSKPNIEAAKLIALDFIQKKSVKEERKSLLEPVEEVKKIKPVDEQNPLFSPIKPLILPPKPIITPAIPVQPLNLIPLNLDKTRMQNLTIPIPRMLDTRLNSLPFSRFDEKDLKDPEEERKLSPEVQMKLAVHVTKVIQQRKVFAMACSNFSAVRTALIKRGWIQKFASEEPSLKTGQIPSDPEAQFTQRMLRNVPLNFIWVYAVNDWNDIRPHTLVNRFPRAAASYTFTTKIGLNQYLQQSHWYNEKGVAEVRFPRTYSILTQEDLLGFIEDYIMTACICLLKLIVMIIVQGEHNIFRDGEVPLDIIDFAVERCREYAAFREHRDLDRKEDCIKANEDSIKRFLSYYYKVVHGGEKFQTATYLQTQGIYLSAKSALQEIQKYWPEMKLDGFKNFWVLKQSNLNCGRGVKILTTLDSIINYIGEVKGPRYVIQKYIERPLLIYDTKFDIRQWILLTGVNPIQIWMYDECYLRFSSQVFTLSDTSESVHLCNNVIQKKYKNAKRHPSLPAENMWDGTRFKKYLDDIGESDKWDNVIYPGMKENIIATIMAAQESMIDRVNSFELYGIDFMLTEDYKPWLIEVNSSPAMGPTTSVTSRLCGQCIHDVIKVVVDRKIDPKADTGRFRIIYNQEARTNVRMMGPDFEMVGRRIPLFTRNLLLLTKRFSTNPQKRGPDVVDLEKTYNGKSMMITDSPSKNVISAITNQKDLASECYYINKQYKSEVAKEKNVSSKEMPTKSTLPVVEIPRNITTKDISLPVENNNPKDQKEKDINLTKVEANSNFNNRTVTEKVFPKESEVVQTKTKPTISSKTVHFDQPTKQVDQASSIKEPKRIPEPSSAKDSTKATEECPLMVDKSTNTVHEFDNLPINRILNMANNNQLQYMGCKLLQGQQPLNYKIYYSKTKARFIVDMEDSGHKYQRL